VECFECWVVLLAILRRFAVPVLPLWQVPAHLNSLRQNLAHLPLGSVLYVYLNSELMPCESGTCTSRTWALMITNLSILWILSPSLLHIVQRNT